MYLHRSHAVISYTQRQTIYERNKLSRFCQRAHHQPDEIKMTTEAITVLFGAAEGLVGRD